jgi:Ca-activated chloride channel family protein
MLGSEVRWCSTCATTGKRIWKRGVPSIAGIGAAALMFLCSGFSAEPTPQEPPRVSITPRTIAPRRTATTRSNMRVDVRMILVPVTVTDPWDRPVMNLPTDAFHLYENNIEQKIVSLFREEGPVSVGFIFDASSSMKKRMDRSIAAIQQFLNNAGKGDEFFLVKFADRASLVQGFTSQPADIISRLSALQPDGWTALLDAIYLGVHYMKSAKNSRRALFVLTDGGDNSSRYTESEMVNLIRESNVRVYAIGLFERPHFLEKIAAESGGKAYLAHSTKDLPETVDRLSNELRNQYVLGYYTNNPDNDGKYRKVRVTLTQSSPPKPLNVVWRHGYYAPLD